MRRWRIICFLGESSRESETDDETESSSKSGVVKNLQRTVLKMSSKSVCSESANGLLPAAHEVKLYGGRGRSAVTSCGTKKRYAQDSVSNELGPALFFSLINLSRHTLGCMDVASRSKRSRDKELRRYTYHNILQMCAFGRTPFWRKL